MPPGPFASPITAFSAWCDQLDLPLYGPKMGQREVVPHPSWWSAFFLQLIVQ
jgi:hypothetical protein